MRIAVGAITHRRPNMFRDLLDSFAAMKRPEGAEVIFTLAENDTSHQSMDVVEAFRAKVPEQVLFELEERPGIPMGRNRVLDMALAADADFLTFVDDDETVTEDWLANLIAGVEARGLELAGAPVRLVPPPGQLSGWNSAVLEHLQERSRKRNAERQQAVEDGTEGKLNIYTNNWCLRLAAQRKLGVRFDESLQFTGGSDTKFSRDMLAAGAKIGWVPEAEVLEPTPQRRLKLGYHYARARDQSTNAVILNKKNPTRARKQALLRFVDGTFLLLASPVMGKYAVAKAMHKYGIAVGRLKAVKGGRSSHYGKDRTGFHTE